MVKMKITNIAAGNFINAIRGMRNAHKSWDKSDSRLDDEGEFVLGGADRELAIKLIKTGTDHRKFMRQMFLSMDIKAPLYWWKQADQYKVATTTNSTSTMHTLTNKPITIEDFAIDDFYQEEFKELIGLLEGFRKTYNSTGNKKYWHALIRLLPSSYLQLRTWTGNYEVARNIYQARKSHKLEEWRILCNKLEELPLSKFITVK